MIIIKKTFDEIGDLVKRKVTLKNELDYQTVGCRLYGRGVYAREIKKGYEISAKKMFLIKKDDVLINRIWAQKGSAGIVPIELENSLVTNDFPVIELDKSQILPIFLSLYFKTEHFWDSCKQHSHGTSGRERLGMKEMMELEIPVPSIEVQEKISKNLLELNNELDKGRNLIINVIDNCNILLYNVYKNIIKGSSRKQMSQIAPIIRRPVKVDISKEYNELGVRSFGKGTFHKPSISGVALGSKRIFWIEPGDLIFSNVFAWEGAIAVAKVYDSQRVGSHRFITCKVNESFTSPYFLCFHFLTPDGLDEIKSASPGGAGRNRTLGLKKLEKIMVPTPEYSKQKHFEEIYFSISTVIKLLENNLEHLSQLHKTKLEETFAFSTNLS